MAIRATVIGLLAKPELNNEEVEVLSFHPTKARFGVRRTSPLSGDHKLSVRGCNLEFGPVNVDVPRAGAQLLTAGAEHVCILPVEGCGKGVVALRDFSKGSTIFAERPVLSHDRGEHSKEPCWQPAEMKGLCGEFAVLTEDLKGEVFSLAATAQPAAGSPLDVKLVQSLVRTFVTNAFETEANTILGVAGAPRGLDHLFLAASRLNHSCKPNCGRHVGDEIRIFAARDIEKGEELSFSYIGFWHDSAFRQQHLQMHYGFSCMCEVCSLPEAQLGASDERRREYDRIEDTIVTLQEAGKWQEVLDVCTKMRDIRREESDESCMSRIEAEEARAYRMLGACNLEARH